MQKKPTTTAKAVQMTDFNQPVIAPSPREQNFLIPQECIWYSSHMTITTMKRDTVVFSRCLANILWCLHGALIIATTYNAVALSFKVLQH